MAPHIGAVLSIAIMAARVAAALFSNISDCDETFNYWEPTHYLLFGSGFQTWEYSPEYAIRSYAYVGLHAMAAQLVLPIAPTKEAVFYTLRLFLALGCGLCEIYFCNSIARHTHFGQGIARMTALLLAVSTGMFISSAAFLPSSAAMAVSMIAMGAWMRQHFTLAVMAVAFMAIVCWPFSAALGIPLALDLLFARGRPATLFVAALNALVVILVPLVAVDSILYGKLVVAPLNILVYNVFSSNTSSELYGTEPFSFYFKNLLLNFSVAFPLALLMPLLTPLLRPRKQAVAHLVFLAPMFVWMAIFFPQPHKEERFLFPVYPMLCLAAAMSAVLCARMVAAIAGRLHTKLKRLAAAGIPILLIGVVAVISVLRITALYSGYHAPLEVYPALAAATSNGETPATVCVGKECVHLEFIKSEFAALLPKHYDPANGTSGIPSHMNDLNREEPTRYVDIETCDYLVELRTGRVTKHEPDYHADPAWETMACADFLDAINTPPLRRALAVPGFTALGGPVYQPYCLLRRVSPQ